MAHDHGSEPELQTPAHPGAGHETTDVSLRPLVLFLVGLVAALTLVILVLRAQFALYEAAPGPPRPALTPLPALGRPAITEPIIQKAPVADLVKLRTEESAALNSEGWVDRKAGIARISIDDAMKILGSRGLPARKAAPLDKPPGAKGSLPQGSPAMKKTEGP
jgi:hypothetical protein